MAEQTSATPRIIPIGRPPKRASEAWWALSRQARQLLKEMRMQGMFGGTPGQAPYWHVQEVGEPKAEIEPLRYIRGAVDAWKVGLDVRVKKWLGF
jgi:hypothetical protein